MKNKKKTIAFCILLGVVLLIFGIALWQADNINAVINSFKYTQEELSEMINKNQEELNKEVQEKYNVVDDFSAEDEAKIMSGEMTVEEAVEKKKEEAEKKQKENIQNEDKNNTAKQTGTKVSPEAKKKTDAIVSERIIEFYSLKAYYLGQLGQMEAKVKADYAALPKEKRNLVGKQELVSKYMSVATSLLNQCDAKMAQLTAELEKEIKAVGGDTSIVGTIKKTYENEKNLKKSYYISKLK